MTVDSALSDNYRQTFESFVIHDSLSALNLQ